MVGGIYFVEQDDTLVRMDEVEYDSEVVLQDLLTTYPDLLAGDRTDDAEPRRWMLIRREAPIAVEGSPGNLFALDHLFLDQDGVPTLVEVKRSSDVRLRREVVGQMLDYAANAVVDWPVNTLRALFEARCEAEEVDPEANLREELEPEASYDEFWQLVKTNLLANRLRLVFFADRIPPELRRVVEFLNRTMDPVEVLAVEVRQYADGDRRVLVPSVIGRSAAAEQRKGSAPRTLTTRQAFLDACEEDARRVYAGLLDYAERTGMFTSWGTKGFTLNHVIGDRNVRVMEGYPPDAYNGHMFGILGIVSSRVRQSDAVVEWYRDQLVNLGFAPAGKSMRCHPTALDGERLSALFRVLNELGTMLAERGLAEDG